MDKIKEPRFINGAIVKHILGECLIVVEALNFNGEKFITGYNGPGMERYRFSEKYVCKRSNFSQVIVPENELSC